MAAKKTTWEVKLIHKLSLKTVRIVLGPKSTKIDVFNELKRRGREGELVSMRKVR